MDEQVLKLKSFMENEYKGEDIRFCSAYLFGDSKYIEKRKQLAEIFNSMATVERPNIIYVRTDVDLKLNGVNIRELTDKLHLAAFFGGDVKEIEYEPSNIVISENLSFFMSVKPKNAVYLYNKGFHLTNQIANFVKRLKYKRVIFFGDFDCQGLAILSDFKKKLPEIEFYPNYQTVEFVFKEYGDRLLDVDLNECLTKHIEESELYDILIERKKKIEQEFLQVLFAKGGLEKPEWIG